MTGPGGHGHRYLLLSSRLPILGTTSSCLERSQSWATEECRPLSRFINCSLWQGQGQNCLLACFLHPCANEGMTTGFLLASSQALRSGLGSLMSVFIPKLIPPAPEPVSAAPASLFCRELWPRGRGDLIRAGGCTQPGRLPAGGGVRGPPAHLSLVVPAPPLPHPSPAYICVRPGWAVPCPGPELR